MINPRLTNCVECNSISNLLSDIDCRLTDLAKREYNNIVYLANKYIDKSATIDLLHYKRILTYKFCNEQWVCDWDVSKIASRVKILINK